MFIRVSIIVLIVSATVSNVSCDTEGTNLGGFFSTVWYKITGNFKFINPIPDGWSRWNNVDVWFSKKENEDWNMTQPKFLGGYGNLPLFIMAQAEVGEVLNDAENIIRDVIELIVQIWRLIRCVVTSFFSVDITWMERPRVNRRAKYEMTMSKREGIVDRIADSDLYDWNIIRCVQRAVEEVLMVLWYIVKVLYYKEKMIGRGVIILVKLVVSIVHMLIPHLAVSVDGTYCFMLGELWSEKLGLWFKDGCTGVSHHKLCLIPVK